MTKPGTREAFLKKRPRRIEPVVVPTDYPDPDLAGATFYVQAMTAAEKTAFDKQFTSRRGKVLDGRISLIRYLLVIATAVTADGQPLFEDGDMLAMQSVDAGLIELLVDKAQELNKFSEADIEELEKNSGPTTAGG